MLKIKNASIHNLKNFSVEIPHNSLVCITGVSGSGKSTLVYDIIEKEANKRFFESFSVYARQFLSKTGVVNADISGIRPVISIRQKTITNDLRSTAGTLSGFSDLLRLLMARCGKTKDTNLKLSRGLFSFNNPLGQCPNCKGIGEEEFIDEKLLIADENKTLRNRALKITLKDGYTIYSQVTIDVLNQVCTSEGFNVDIPFKNLDKRMKNVLFYGSDKIKIPFGKHTLQSRMKWKGITAKPREEGFYKGIIPVMSEILKRDRNPNILRFCSSKVCSHCHGSGLKPEVLQVVFKNKNFFDLTEKTFKELSEFFREIKPQNNIEDEIISALLKKCKIIEELGLDYLTPGRKSSSLSGGESQRLRISTVLDNDISGIMYIFDEPSIGLHETDNIKLIKILKKLVDKGNSVIVVEHNKETILASDYLIDIGPMAGYKGGKLLYSGKTSNFNIKNSITYQELNSKNYSSNKINYNNENYVSFEGIQYHNLKNITVKFKINGLNVITGVSGAGKSSLANGIIINYYKNKNHENFKKVSSHKFNDVIYIDAKQPGKNSRSNAATYTGIFDDIRKLFASLPNSLSASSFSFNTGSGRCLECMGKGEIEITMHFLENIKVQCDRCKGKRFNEEVLKIKYKNRNIYDILEMEISEASIFFKEESKICRKLEVLNKLGLGYLKLGQPASTFSGGEAKRLKLSAYLDSKSKNNLILLDEPTNGLSMYDTKILLKNLLEITKAGNTIIAIEHDSFFISNSDHIIDLGPGAGDLGGNLLYQGNFANLLKCKKSLTAQIFNIKPKYLSKNEDKSSNEIIISNAATNNLKNISCKIQKNTITLIKGGEGAGKTSLCIDTIFNEANNLYLSSLSAYSRQFIGNLKKGKFKSIKNLSPAISLTREKNRTDGITFGQVSGLYDLYRLLYSRFAETVSKLPIHTKNNSLFSFMHISGACQNCSGRGFIEEIDINKLADKNLSLENGALNSSKPGKFHTDKNGQYMAILYTVMDKYKIEKGKKLVDYKQNELDIIFLGTKDETYDVKWNFKRSNRNGIMEFQSKWIGFLNLIQEDYLKNIHNQKRKNFQNILSENTCPICNGKRLNKIALSYKIKNLSISDLSALNIDNQILFLIKSQVQNGQILIDKIITKLQRLQRFNLGYISSDRSYNSLSSGEKQRLRLAMLAKEKLKDILYILDEPANGLYHKEENLISDAVLELKEQGNTVIICDPKERFINNADSIIQLKNGDIEYNNSAKLYKTNNLFRKILFPKRNSFFEVKGAFLHNLKNIDVKFNYNTLNIVYGPCGSGKSTLVFDIVAKSLKDNIKYGCRNISGNFSNIIIANDHLSSITIGAYFDVNKILFEKLAKANGIKKSEFTSPKNYCHFCSGKGIIKGNLDFLSERETICPICNGRKFNNKILNYKLSEYSIYDLLNFPINGNSFEDKKSISDLINNKKIATLESYFNLFGLKKLTLNRKFTTLSVWERKRLVIIKELLNNKDNNLIVIDEPAASLDIENMNLLIKIFMQIIKTNTIIITEHDQNLISCAGNSIKLGHGSGDKGGYLVSV